MPFAAIIVILKWWAWVKERVAKLSDQGHIALAIDLYRGKVAENSDTAGELLRGLPEDRAKGALNAAFGFLASQPNLKKNAAAAIGWCMGGGYSIDVAWQEPRLAANAIHHGHHATDPA